MNHNDQQQEGDILETGRTNKSGIVFGLFIFLDQIMVCLLYGFLFQFHPDVINAPVFDELMLVAVMTIMVIVGFGLINAYITSSSFSGMSMTLLIFVLSIEHYFLVKAFWEKAGTNDLSNGKYWSPEVVKKISLVNVGQDRFEEYRYTHYSFVDAIACALANVVAFGSLVGRVQLIETFLLTLFGTFLYEVNNQLFHRFEISDVGYGMRIFLFGGFLGLISSVILASGRKAQTDHHRRYSSSYATSAISLIGLLIVFCTFPTLCIGSLYETSTNNGYIVYSCALKMWLALIAGVIGSFAASALSYRKIFLHDLIFSGINGGIIYSSSSNLHNNPAAPLTVGFLAGLITSLLHSRQLRNFNSKGVSVSLSHLNHYIIPSFLSGIISAILQAIGKASTSNYVHHIGANRSLTGQAGMQLAGLGLAIAIGILGGVVVGLLLKCVNKMGREDHFNDGLVYKNDRSEIKEE